MLNRLNEQELPIYNAHHEQLYNIAGVVERGAMLRYIKENENPTASGHLEDKVK